MGARLGRKGHAFWVRLLKSRFVRGYPIVWYEVEDVRDLTERGGGALEVGKHRTIERFIYPLYAHAGTVTDMLSGIWNS